MERVMMSLRLRSPLEPAAAAEGLGPAPKARHAGRATGELAGRAARGSGRSRAARGARVVLRSVVPRAISCDARSSTSAESSELRWTPTERVLAPASGNGFELINPLTPVRMSEKDCLEVIGGGKLEGHVRISGAKNSALPLLAGCLLCSEPLELHNVPALKDIRRMCEVLESVGAKVKGGPGMVSIDPSTLTSVSPSAAIVRTLRASFFVIGSLIGRMGEAEVPLPGGCAIGARPVDLHIRGLEAMGATVEIRDGKVFAKAPLRPGSSERRLVGCKIYMDYPSVGATETLMMAAALADGETVIENVAQEPEVVDLADLLNSMGAKVLGAGSNCITVQGVARLHATRFTVIPDRIEAGTFLAAAAITASEITLSPVVPRHLTAVLAKLQGTGCLVTLDRPDCLRIAPPAWGRPLTPTDITTLPYPGFPTDMQAQFMTLLTRCQGTSVIRETVFENRMQHVPELCRMGGAIKLSGSNTAIIAGEGWAAPLWGKPAPGDAESAAAAAAAAGAEPASPGGPWDFILGRKALGLSKTPPAARSGRLTGATVTASDLRAGAALVLAGLAAEGTTYVQGLEHLDRGYDRFELKLQGLGAPVRRVPQKEDHHNTD